MVVVARVDYIKKQVAAGAGVRIVTSTGFGNREKFKVLLRKHDGVDAPPACFALKVLDLILEAEKSASVMDRGHKHSDGTVECCFWVTRTAPCSKSAGLETAAAEVEVEKVPVARFALAQPSTPAASGRPVFEISSESEAEREKVEAAQHRESMSTAPLEIKSLRLSFPNGVRQRTLHDVGGSDDDGVEVLAAPGLLVKDRDAVHAVRSALGVEIARLEERMASHSSGRGSNESFHVTKRAQMISDTITHCGYSKIRTFASLLERCERVRSFGQRE